MAWNDPKKDGVIETLYVDFNLLERQLENQGEMGFVSVGSVLSILRGKRKKPETEKG